MSFWKQSPGPHWSHSIESVWKGPVAPFLFQQEFPKPSFSYQVLRLQDAAEVVLLLRNHYQTFPRSRSSLSAAQIQSYLAKGWIGIGIRGGVDAILVGIVFSRPLGHLYFTNTPLDGNSTAGMVDFFCVHKDYRGHGLGSRLLHALAYETSLEKRLIHFFQREGLPLCLLPPVWTSSYVWRRRTVPMPVNLSQYVEKAPALPRGHALWNRPSTPSETAIYECRAFPNPIYVAVTDLFHVSVPDNLSMGEVSWVWYDKQKGAFTSDQLKRVIETVTDMCPYDMIFMDKTLPHDSSLWTQDSAYSYYSFNLHPGQFLTLKASFTF